MPALYCKSKLKPLFVVSGLSLIVALGGSSAASAIPIFVLKDGKYQQVPSEAFSEAELRERLVQAQIAADDPYLNETDRSRARLSVSQLKAAIELKNWRIDTPEPSVREPSVPTNQTNELQPNDAEPQLAEKLRAEAATKTPQQLRDTLQHLRNQSPSEARARAMSILQQFLEQELSRRQQKGPAASAPSNSSANSVQTNAVFWTKANEEVFKQESRALKAQIIRDFKERRNDGRRSHPDSTRLAVIAFYEKYKHLGVSKVGVKNLAGILGVGSQTLYKWGFPKRRGRTVEQADGDARDSPLSPAPLPPLSPASTSDSSSDMKIDPPNDAVVKLEDAARHVPSDSEILAECKMLTSLMTDPDGRYVNCVRLSEALAHFLITGSSIGHPAETTQAPPVHFDLETELYTRSIQVKREDGTSRARTLSWLEVQAANIAPSEEPTLAGFLPHPTVQITESKNGRMVEVVDLENNRVAPVRVHINELDRYISRKLKPVGHIVGAIVMSRVNRHTEGYMHVMLFDAYKTGPNSGMIRYLDPQLEQPLHANITDIFDFLRRTGQRINQDTFSPFVDTFILHRKKGLNTQPTLTQSAVES